MKGKTSARGISLLKQAFKLPITEIDLDIEVANSPPQIIKLLRPKRSTVWVPSNLVFGFMKAMPTTVSRKVPCF